MRNQDHPIFQRLAAMNLHPGAGDWSASVMAYAQDTGITYEEASAAAYAAYERAYCKCWAFGIPVDLDEPYEVYEPDPYHVHSIMLH